MRTSSRVMAWLMALGMVLSGCLGIERPPSASCPYGPTLCGTPPGGETAAPQTWSLTGSIGTTRNQHTATLLTSGKVLVAGGSGYDKSYAEAELYDPGTGTWSPTGSLATGRDSHTATLLHSGKVLVAGGHNPHGSTGWDSTTLVSAELYDPGTGTWSPTGSLATGRSGHKATLLLSGRVLVTGGATSAEVYDPDTGTWSPTGNPTTDGPSYTATLLASGKVLVTGSVKSKTVLGRLESAAEVYDPETNTWSPTGSTQVLRSFGNATRLPSGKVLITGGSATKDVTAELYDPETGIWSHTGSLATGRFAHTSTLLPSGKVLVAAGDFIFPSEEYDPSTGTWSTTGDIHYLRKYPRAVLLTSGKVLMVGGSGYNTTELYTP